MKRPSATARVSIPVITSATTSRSRRESAYARQSSLYVSAGVADQVDSDLAVALAVERCSLDHHPPPVDRLDERPCLRPVVAHRARVAAG